MPPSGENLTHLGQNFSLIDLADYYTNTGGMYVNSLVFPALGLPATDEFWSAPFAEWTQLKSWSGKPFPKDYAVNY